MDTTPAKVEAFVRATRPPWNSARQAFDWYGMCAGLTYRTILECGGDVPDGAYGSAWLAYLATTIESRDPLKAPAGAVHYWDYTGVASNGQTARWGHVTLDILGGGTDTLSATGHAHEVWARSAGLISVAAQSARPGMRYVGWSRFYGRRNRLTIDVPTSAGAGTQPFPNEEDEMNAEQAQDLATTKAKVDVLFDYLLPGISGVKGNGPMAKVQQETWAFARAAAGEPDVVVDYDRLASAIVKAGGAAPTAAEIAKAVNDDAARRLAT